MAVPTVSIVDILSQSATMTGGLWALTELCGLALITSVVVLAFMYVWSVIFKNQQMTGMVKIELYEVFASVVIVIIILGVVGMLETLTVGDFFPRASLPQNLYGDTNIYNASEMYFLQVKDEMLGWIELSYVLNTQVDELASITPYTRPLSVGYTSTPFAGLATPIKQLLNHSILGVIIAYIINYAQYFVFIFAIDVFLKYYLPLGIFLRCFTPTRRIGGSIIAVTIAFLIVFPVITTATYIIFYSPEGPMVNFQDFIRDQITGAVTKSGEQLGKMVFGDGVSFWKMVFLPFYAILDAINLFTGTIFFLVLGLAAGMIGRAFLIGYIMPTFSILILVQSAKGLGKTIGEEIDISALTRLI